MFKYNIPYLYPGPQLESGTFVAGTLSSMAPPSTSGRDWSPQKKGEEKEAVARLRGTLWEMVLLAVVVAGAGSTMMPSTAMSGPGMSIGQYTAYCLFIK